MPDATGLELIAAEVRERLGDEAVVGTMYHRGQATLDVAPAAVRDAIAFLRDESDEPYECGLPSEVTQSFRFGISFYLIAMLFILFDIEVVFLYPVAVRLNAFGAFALGEVIVFVVLLFVAFVFVWRRGALEWK